MGTLFTGVIQTSAASMAILQDLSRSGSITYGDTVTYTVQVAGEGADTPVPTGRVQFYLGSVASGNELGAPLTLQDGKATLTVGHSKLTYPGTPHKVMAVYLACAALGINCMARQTFESAKVRKALLLKDSQTPLCVQTLGYKPRGLLDLAF